jgi:peptidyl-prolyl cis-trans isomerase-like 4
MANHGPDMSASQFFITLTSEGADFDRRHTVFGLVGEGQEVLAKINVVYCDKAGRPYTDIRIKHTYILEDPFEDPPRLILPLASPEPVQESDRLLADESVPDEGDLEESIMTHEAKTRSIVLEMLGDLPDAEIKPPDNVAFVCKLNKVTTDADLYMLFSRFGPVKSCEVIRDWKTGDSLQYGFVEYENPKDCDEAILKMNGVQVDERRIRVDYSQSVAKLWKKYRRGRPAKQEEPALRLKENAHDTRFKQDRHKLLMSRRRSRS